MSADIVGPWVFDRSTKYPPKRKGLFTSDLPSAEDLARRKKQREVDAIPDPPKPARRKP